MGDLTSFLGNDTVRILLNNATKNINEFRSQSTATKVVLADELIAENELYKQGIPILIDTLDEVQAQNEVQSIAIKNYEKELGVKNDDFIKKHKISVTMTKNQEHARTAVINHIKNMNLQATKSLIN